MYQHCPKCDDYGSPLGVLGSLAHFRCRACGWDWSVDASEVESDDVEQDDEPEVDEPDDRFADAEALASAGFGTDEDYGFFGGGWED
jgi:hypothetical protein